MAEINHQKTVTSSGTEANTKNIAVGRLEPVHAC